MGLPEPTARDNLRFHVIYRRAQLRLSQTALAERSGIPQAAISRVETGRANFTLDMLDRLARALETTPANLLKHIDDDSSDAAIARSIEETTDDDMVDADAFLQALDEADGTTTRRPERYSNRGRRPTPV